MRDDTERAFRRHKQEYHRRRDLPRRLDYARRLLASLENEARHFGMTHLLNEEGKTDEG